MLTKQILTFCRVFIPVSNGTKSTTRSSANAEDSADVAEILKANPKYMGASQVHAYFSSGCGFMVGLGKPDLCTKFEVPSFSHCVNIEMEPRNFGELP